MAAFRGLGVLALAWAAAGQGSTPEVYKGLELTVTTVERAKNVSLQDCPPGENIVRGVIRPTESNEFATVAVEVKVLASFEPVQLEKAVLYDDSGKVYKTAQSFGDMKAQPSYTCTFSFRVPQGVKLARFAIGEASFDVSALEK